MQLKSLSPERQKRVIKLHSEAFARGKEICGPCKGHCCQGCAGAEGYLRYGSNLSTSQLDALKQTHGFDKKRGFLSDTGCKLPLEERSGLCIGFMCWSGKMRPATDDIWKKEERAAAGKIGDTFYEQRKENSNV